MRFELKKSLALTLIALSGSAAFAQAAPAEPTPDYTLSFNVGAVTGAGTVGIKVWIYKGERN